MQGVPGQATFGGFTELLTWEAGTLWDVAFLGFFLSREGFTEKRFPLTLSPATHFPSHRQLMLTLP